MPTNRDYYEILGIEKNASEADIKKAYRRLAREHHPDMVNESDKAAAEKRFKEINEAYQVLSDPQKRKMYDQFGHAGPGYGGGRPGSGSAGGGPFGGFGGSGSWGPFTYTYTTNNNGGMNDFDPFDIFEDFFGFRGFRGRRPRKGKNLYYELHLEFKDAVFGLEKVINVESGKVKIKIPAGVRNGTEIRFSGKGMTGGGDIPPGDLLLTIRLRLPEKFRRIGDHLGTVLEINMVEAALGTTLEVPVVDLKSKDGLGSAKLKIPSGTQSGTQFRLRNKGLPLLNRSGRGDIIAQVFVNIPKNLSSKQKKILKEYEETLG
jgi:molecular chaperone DnaJ